MAFQRALWHSGLQYRQLCRNCFTTITYTDHQMDFRPWYPDGFVYCPKCNKPLRHSEAFAINPDGTPYYAGQMPQPVQPQIEQPAMEPQQAAQPVPPAQGQIAYCIQCGKPYQVGLGRFCAGCGSPVG